MKNSNRSDRFFLQQTKEAVAALKRGKVVAIPTETYYGLAVDPENEQALAALFRLKKRPPNKPILLLISHRDQISRLAESIPAPYEALMDEYWPGPLTLVFPAQAHLSNILTGGSRTIGIRLTPNPYAARIIELLNSPITATSANISDFPPARRAEEVHNAFGGQLGYVVDGGVSEGDMGSTVVSVSAGQICIERYGKIILPADVPTCLDVSLKGK